MAKNVIQPAQYGTLAGNPLYGQYMLDARRRWEDGLTVTVQDVRDAYKRAGHSLAREMSAAPSASVLRRSHLRGMFDAVDQAFNGVNQQVLDGLTKGIHLSVAQGSSGPQRLLRHLLGGVVKVDGIDAMYTAVNQNAVFGLLNRSRGPKGLNLADSVWETTALARGSVRGLVEGAVARGLDSRKLAEQVQQFMQPGQTDRKHRTATARRLGIRADLPYPAMRLARTELTHAFHEGSIMGNRATPSYEGIIWRLSQQHPVPDICDDLAQGQANDGSGFWPAGQEPNTPHSQCMCHQVPKHRDLERLVDELQGWLKDPSSEPKWEQWYEEKAKPFISLPPPPGPPKPQRGGGRTTAPAQPKPPRAAKAVKEQGFPAKVKARIAKGINTDQDVIDLGRMVDEEWQKGTAALDDTRTKLIDDIQAKWARYRDMENKHGSTFNMPEDLSKQHTALLEEVVKGKAELDKISKAMAKSEAAQLQEVLAKVRPMGLPKGEKLAVTWNSDADLVKRLEKETKFYPTDWWKRSQADGPMLVKAQDRGSYGHKDGRRVMSEIALSKTESVTIHELGHRMEATVPRILDMQRAFFRRRTNGENWVDVYPENTKRGANPEWAKRDKFTNLYMGKEYYPWRRRADGTFVPDPINPPGESYAYELLTMGMESIFSVSEYGLKATGNKFLADKEYRHFILGLLAGL